MKNGLYKFIEISGEFRFCEVEDALIVVTHKSLLKDSENRSQVQSAGTIAVFDSYWRIYDWFSTSLSVGCNESVIPKLTEIIGRKYEPD